MLKENLNDILDGFAINFIINGENIHKKLAKDEKMINYNYLFLKKVIVVFKKLIFWKDLKINTFEEEK